MHVATPRTRLAGVGAFLVCFASCVSWFSASGQTLPGGIQLRPLSSVSVQPIQQANAGQTNPPAADPRLSALSQRLQTWIEGNSTKGVPFAAAQAVPSHQSQIHYHPNGIAGEIRRRFSKPALRQQPNIGTGRNVAVSQQKARDFLRDHKSHLRVDDSDGEFVVKGVEADALSRHHIRFAQSYRGLSVWPCELTVHVDPVGEVDLVNSTSIETPRAVVVVPTLKSVQALARARNDVFGGNANALSQPELIIYGPIGAAPRLAWKFDMAWTDLDGKRCVVDAADGRILSAVSLIHDNATVGSGIDALGAAQPLNLWQQGSTYYLVDTSKAMYDPSSSPPSSSTTRGGITIYDSHNTPATSNPQTFGDPVFAVSASANSGWIPDAVSAAYALSQVFDYYYFTHGRNSLDNQGESIIALVRVGISYPNAYWSGPARLMAFGDGYPRSLDVCGHELTHGVVDSIGDGGILEYQGQSGALNEAFADIFGECIEGRTKGTTDWLIGSDLTIGAIRNLASPGSFEIGPGRQYPSRMSQFIVTAEDHGGVHWNSVIIGHCFYLLAAGLDGAIGIADAERIFYRAMNFHLQKQSQFVDARRACIASAEELFGIASLQARKTEAAFDAVEILDAPPTSPPSSIPAVQAPDSTLALRWSSTANAYYLVRREFAKGDFVSGRLVDTVNYLASQRVSVSGNGEVMIFVTEDHNVGVGTTDGKNAELVGVSGLAHSVALSPDARFLAIVLRDSGGNPTSQIRIADLEANTQRTYSLYATTSEGERLNIVRYADVMDFSSDRTRLIFDAYCEAVTSDGHKFRGWTLFALNLASGTIDTLVDLNSDYDIGNPALGNVWNNLVVFEATDRQTGISTEIAGDLFSGKMGIIGTVDGLGVPGYTGDDRAIVYSRNDSTVVSDFSLYLQPVAADGITVGGRAAAKWMGDADFGVIYRRGAFHGSNAPPSVAITTLTNGQILTTPVMITIQANASDSDGSVARVEFYDGSIKLGASAAAPFTFSWKNPALGSHRLIARAVDNLGGTDDSAAVEVFVYPPCTYSLSSTAMEFGAGGGTGTVTVATGAWCDWAVINSNSWITISSGAAYRGDGLATFVVSSNTTAIERRGQFLIAGRVFSVVQYPPDLTRPTITIRAPSANSMLNNSLITLTGTASDAQGVARVEYQLGSNVPQTADGTAAWSAPLELMLGTNAVQVWSVDLAGNHSITNSRSFYYSRAGEGKGNYNGLVGTVDEVGIACSGYFTFNVSANGAYSASILLAGKKYTASGQLGADGAVTNVAVRSGTNVLITDWMVNLDGGDVVTGRVVSGSCVVPLAGYRPVFNAKTNQAPQVGKYTLIIPGQPGSTDAPEGDGYGTAIVDGNGKLKLSAVLADGTKVSQSVPISKSATWPLFSSLNRGSGLLWSWVSFGPTLTNDLSGRLTWIKGPSPSKHYTNGFVSSCSLTGSRYIVPTVETNRVLGISEALLSFSGGNRSQTLDVNIVLGLNGKVTNASPHKLSLSFVLTSGLFSGTITEQGTTKATTFKGAVLQKANWGSGYFLGTNQSGRVLLHRSP